MKYFLIALTLLAASSMSRAVGATSDVNSAPNSSLNGYTADSQFKSSRQDTELTRKIRRELTRDDSLSIYAKNVKVITRDGEVILRGPVRTADEEGKVLATAKRVAGDVRVKNQLEVKPNQ